MKWILAELMSKQVNKNPTTLVRMDRGIVRLLKIKAAADKTTIRALLEGVAANLIVVDSERINHEKV